MHDPSRFTRRDALASVGTGFGMLALADLLAAAEAKPPEADRSVHPFSVRRPHPDA